MKNNKGPSWPGYFSSCFVNAEYPIHRYLRHYVGSPIETETVQSEDLKHLNIKEQMEGVNLENVL